MFFIFILYFCHVIQSFILFFNATLRQMKTLTNRTELFLLLRCLKNIINYSVAEIKHEKNSINTILSFNCQLGVGRQLNNEKNMARTWCNKVWREGNGRPCRLWYFKYERSKMQSHSLLWISQGNWTQRQKWAIQDNKWKRMLICIFYTRIY